MKLDGHDIPFPTNEVSRYARDGDILDIPIKRVRIIYFELVCPRS